MIASQLRDFEAHRRYLFGIAYRMLGSAAEAEDMVQETFLRADAADPVELRAPRAFLSTVVTRLCLDRLKEARTRREAYIGPWLPEPIRTDTAADDDALIHAESISTAFLILLESLTPLERAVYLLHEVFDYSHAEVAEIVGRDELACRQLLHRARKDLVERRPRYTASKDAHRRLLEGFAGAMNRGDVQGLEQLLAEDVRAVADGGGKVKGAARRPILGRNDVARYLAGFWRRAPSGMTLEVAEINGWPALLVRVAEEPVFVLQVDTDGERIYAVRTTVNPDKLERL